jgi:hypothetical protein
MEFIKAFSELPRRIALPGRGSYYLELHHEGAYVEIGYYMPFGWMSEHSDSEILVTAKLEFDYDAPGALAIIRNFLREKNLLRYGSNSD